MPSDQQPDRLRLVAEPEERLEPSTRRGESRQEPRGESRQEPRLARTEPRAPIDPDADLRIRGIGSLDPMAELDDIAEEDETIAALQDEDDQVGDEAPRGRWLPIATAVFALLGFAGIVWYAYQWGAGSVPPEELPVIRAEEGPSKIRPESPGGLEVPYQETLALNQVEPDPEKPQVERLLPPPETPIAPPAAAVPAAPPATPEAAAEATPTPAPAAPASPPAAELPATEVPAVEVPVLEAKKPEPVPETTKSVPAQTAAAANGGFVLQLASLTAKERAPAEWGRLQKIYPKILGDRELVVFPVDLGSRGKFYRVQAGFFADRASADAACAELKAKGQDCLVTKR